MEVTVTQQDIKEGVPITHKACPVALALNRATEGQGYWSVGSGLAVHVLFNHNKVYILPSHVSKFISDFDFGDPVEPISFSLLKERK